MSGEDPETYGKATMGQTTQCSENRGKRVKEREEIQNFTAINMCVHVCASVSMCVCLLCMSVCLCLCV